MAQFKLYALDCYLDPDCGWIENERQFLGNVSIDKSSVYVEKEDIVDALQHFKIHCFFGRTASALEKELPKGFFVEDVSCDLPRWEIGVDEMPVYLLEGANKDA